MAKFLIGVLTGIVLTGLILVVFLFALARIGRQPPVVADNSTLILDLEGEIPERPPVEVPVPFFEGRRALTVVNVWDMLRKAAVDPKIKAVVLQPQGIGASWGKLQEIRGDLEKFRKTGKPLVAYLKTPGAREYYIATAADRIYMPPEDWLNLKGMRFELMFFKKTLDKIGVEVQIQHAGKYKDYGDMFTRTDMSPETREVLNSVLDDLFGNLVATIAAGRKKSPEEIRATIDQGPFISRQALDKGLVDALRFEDEMYGELKDRLKSGEIKKVSAQTYARVPASSVGLEGKNRLALVVGQGAISRGGVDDDGLSDEGIASEGFNKLLRRVRDDAGIKGVIVRIDSPGGEVAASDEIWREMNLLKQKKPVVISMSDTAASGGYYMAMTGDPILAYPGTVTGSIGVVFGKPTLRGLYDKIGITKDILMRGKFAAIDSDYKPLNAAEQAKLAEAIDADYYDFVSKVARARHKNYADIEPLAQGRVWLGSQARQRGLVDELGGLDRAIELVKEKAKIPAAEKVSLQIYPPRRSIFDLMLNRPSGGVMDDRIRNLLRDSRLRVWMRPGLLRMMPYMLEIQ